MAAHGRLLPFPPAPCYGAGAMTTFTILLGGELEPTPRLAGQIAGSRVVAADSGVAHAATLGLVPELWLGDFDSMPEIVPEPVRDVPRLVFPTDKDKTDGELAVEAALHRGASSLIMVGAFGGPRADHAFLHRQEGVPLRPGRTRFDYGDGTPFSILTFSDLAGLGITGAKWPLHDVAVPFGSSLTLSNEVSGELEITLNSGRALLLARPQSCNQTG